MLFYSAREDLNPWCLTLFRGGKLSLSGYHIFLGIERKKKTHLRFFLLETLILYRIVKF